MHRAALHGPEQPEGGLITILRSLATRFDGANVHFEDKEAHHAVFILPLQPTYDFASDPLSLSTILDTLWLAKSNG